MKIDVPQKQQKQKSQNTTLLRNRNINRGNYNISLS